MISRENQWRKIFRIGAVAVWVAAAVFRRNLDAEWMLLRTIGLVRTGPAAAPGDAAGWFLLLQQSPLLGLTFLNLFDLVNYLLVGLTFFALCAALWRSGPAVTGTALTLAVVGIGIYLAANPAFTMLSLSAQYAAAGTSVQRDLLLAAGQASLAIHQNNSFAGRGIYPSFLLISTAGLLLSIVMLRSPSFRRGCAAAGILANGLGLGSYIFLVAAPSLVAIPISLSAMVLVVWYVQVGVHLWRLGGKRANSFERSSPAWARHKHGDYLEDGIK